MAGRAQFVRSGPVGLEIQAAIPIAYLLAVSLHFTLQRYFVFHDAGAFALAVHHQVGRYVVIGLAQYGGTAAMTALLPALFGIPSLSAYFIAAIGFALTTFFLLRSHVFHREPAGGA
jgi:putative flippase GtrA